MVGLILVKKSTTTSCLPRTLFTYIVIERGDITSEPPHTDFFFITGQICNICFALEDFFPHIGQGTLAN